MRFCAWWNRLGGGADSSENANGEEVARERVPGTHPLAATPELLEFVREQAAAAEPFLPPGTGSSAADAAEILQAGIAAHEAAQLERATALFSAAAVRGSTLGVFMYAVSLRNGWGCQRREREAFALLLRMAEFSMGGLCAAAGGPGGAALPAGAGPATLSRALAEYSPQPRPRTPDGSVGSTPRSPAGSLDSLGRFTRRTETEMALALVELAQCFRHGWGCRKSKLAYLFYLEAAAELGDRDAQVQLGEALLRGSGARRDKRAAAYWFRQAESRGARLLGLHWIHKPKYASDAPS